MIFVYENVFFLRGILLNSKTNYRKKNLFLNKKKIFWFSI